MTTSELVSFLALLATVLIALASWRSAKAAERTAQAVERTQKAAFSAVLKPEFFLAYAVFSWTSLEPVFIDTTEDYNRLLEDWVRLPADQKLTKKHAVFASVKNLGPSVARKVSFVAITKIVQPNMGAPFTREVATREVPILEVGHRRATLVHVFDEPTAQCTVRVEEVRVTYTTIAGETLTEVSDTSDFLGWSGSPIQVLER